MDLNEFTFIDAAELDQQLIHYFINTAEYQQAKKGKTNFIVGRVGTGKSAIVEKLRADAEASGGLIVDLTAKGGSDLIGFRGMEPAVPKIQPEDFEKAWKYTVLIRIMRAIVDAGQGSFQSSLDWDRISQSLDQLGILTQKDPIGLIAAFVSKHASSVKKVKIAGFEIERDLAALLSKQDPFTLIDGCLPNLNRLVKKRGTWVLIDGVDLGFNDPDKAENFIIGHYRSIPSLIALHLPGLSVITTFRAEYIDPIFSRAPSTRKYEAQTVRIDWTPESIQELVGQRIRFFLNLKRGQSPSVYWEALFDKTVDVGESSFEFIMKRTFLRPRDVIQYCEHARKLAAKRGDNKIRSQDILKAERAYSELKSEEVSGDLSYRYNNLLDFLKRFRGRKAKSSYTDLEILFDLARQKLLSRFEWLGAKDTSEILEVLIAIGFLGVIEGKNAKFAYASDDVEFSEDTMFTVHPAFHAYLNIR